MLGKRLVALMVVCSVWFGLAETARGETDYYARYLTHHKIHVEFYNTWPNSGSIAWGEFSTLDAFAFMYAARRDTYWLDKMIEHTEVIISNMHDTPHPQDLKFWEGYKDGFKGWGDIDYDPRRYYQEYMVHDGRIISPILKFVEFVYNDPSLHAKYKEKADRYLKIIEENVMAKWRKNWVADRHKGKLRGMGIELEHWGGWKQIGMPNNQYLAFTAALSIAHGISQSPHYKPAVAGLPEFYRKESSAMLEGFKKDGLVHNPKHNSYWWAYRRTKGVLGKRPESLHYGGMDMQAVIEGYLRGCKVFNIQEMRILSNTFTRAMWNGDRLKPSFSGNVGGCDGSDTCLEPDMIRFCAIDPFIYTLVGRWMENHPGSAADNRRTAIMAYLQNRRHGLSVERRFETLPDDVLIKFLKADGRSLLRSFAAYEIGRRGLRDNIPDLIAAAGNDKDADTVSMAIHSLGKLQARQSAALLVNTLKGHQSYLVRMNCAWALGVIQKKGDKSVEQALMEALKNDSSQPVRCAAADSLGRLKVKSALPLLGKFALAGSNRDDKKTVRRHCLYALGLLGTEEAVPFLLKHLQKQVSTDKEDEWWWARWQATVSLGRIGLKSPEVISELEKETTRFNRDNRRIACKVLADLGSKQSIPVLQKALKDNNWLVRWAAREAIERLRRGK